MGLGILEDRVMDHVPGTTRYFDDPERPQYAIDGTSGLKCDTSGPVPIILVPQPSDDPNDPLNWPLWKRDLITFILSMTAIFGTALGPILAANTLTLVIAFSRPFTDIAILTGYFLLGVGGASIFYVPSARIWGKRHTFILGLLLMIGSSAWGGATDGNYNSMIGARVVQGIGCAPYEALVNAAVGDLYCVHQRGKRMAFTNLAVFGGAFFTPILVGKITHAIGWWWTFYIVAIFCAACLPAVVLWCPETAYRRDSRLNTDMLSEDEGVAMRTKAAAPPVDAGPASSSQDPDAEREKNVEAGRTSDGNGNDVVPPKATWVQSMALFSGRKTDEQFWKLLLRPFPLYLQPAFLWSTLVGGTLIGWTVFIGVILAQFFIGFPLWWGEVQTGYAYTSAFIGAVLGFLIAGGLADFSARWLTRLNGGIYEPEFRMILVIPQFVFGVMGLFGWGLSMDLMKKNQMHWSIPLMFFMFEVCGMVCGAVASSLYIVDAYRDLAIEGFTCMIIFKNFFSYALTYKAYAWLVQNQTHATPVFNALGAVQVVIIFTTVPMYIYGKRVRGYFHRHDILTLFGVR